MAGRPPGQNNPISYKTVPNRNKTQKWQQAKTYNYDGDDWGGYDPYDEYGADEQPPVPQPPSFQYAQQPSQLGQRNVTTPAAAYGAAQGAGGYGSLGKGRTNSFDNGDDRRAFSGPGGYDTTLQQQDPRPPHPGQHQHEVVGRRSQERGRDPSEEYYQKVRQREFSNPTHIPPPLSTSRPGTSSGADPTLVTAKVAAQTAAGFPPRKSSLSQEDPPAEFASQPTSAASGKATDNPLPFIRPSDIYKRMDEEKERERASMDSSRPSMDSIQRSTTASPPAAGGIPTAGGIPIGGSLGTTRGSEDSHLPGSVRRPSLDPVAEARESFVETDNHRQPPESLAPESALLRQDYPPTPGHVLPPVRQVSGFGSDFFPPTVATPAQEEEPAPLGIATRAPIGADPAADILAERQPTRAQPGHDPASEILAERQASTTSSLQRTPVTTQAPPTLASDVTLSPNREPQAETDLQRQHSQGYRSVVNKAFHSGRRDDNSVPVTPVSREGSQRSGLESGMGVSRSNTDSTSGISPIMSRVPSAATAQRNQQSQAVDTSVAPIEEVQEPASAANSRPSSVMPSRKPAAGHNRNVSSTSATSLGAGSGKGIVEPGYRRSLDPPSSDNSPARTPGLEDASNHRLSQGLLATLDHTRGDAPDVRDQGAEVVEPSLENVMSLEDSKLPSEVHGPEAAGIQIGRGRSGTNYSVREADLARELSSSPEKDDGVAPAIAEDARISRDEFLKSHRDIDSGPSMVPSSPSDKPPPLQAQGRSNTSTSLTSLGSESGKGTPGKSRVRVIKDKYDEMHATTRRSSNASIGSSKSSWSRFDGSPQRGNSPVKETPREGSRDGVNVAGAGRLATGAGMLAAHRPELSRDASFKPDLPGGWISSVPTPTDEVPPLGPTGDKDVIAGEVATPRQSTSFEDEEPDLTPTTKRVPLLTGDPATSDAVPKSFLSQAKTAGAALGASLIGNVGVGHNTRDFANPESEEAPKVEQPETAEKPFTGDNLYHTRPHIDRWESDASGATAVSKASIESVEATPSTEQYGDVVGGYFPSPLRLNRSREEREAMASGLHVQRPTVQPTLSTDISGQDVESDRLRKDIVRSLGNIKQAQDDAARDQDALETPENQLRVSQGSPPPHPAETTQHARDLLPSQRGRIAAVSPSPGSRVASSEAERDRTTSPAVASQPLLSTAETSPRPGLLDQRFSWETRPAPALAGALWSPERGVNESFAGQPEQPPSRLQVVNTEAERSPTSPVAKNPEMLLTSSSGLAAPSEVSRTSSMSGDEDRSRNIPSYYAGGRDDDSLQAVAPVAVDDSSDEKEVASVTIREPLEPLPKGSEQQDTAYIPHSPTASSKNAAAVASQPSGRIPPFRELMAIKDPKERISHYDSTRETFAAMDTGISNWLSSTLASQPEHGSLQADLAKPYKPSLLASTGTFRGHRSSPSIIKNIKNFTSDNIGGTSSVERKGSASGASIPAGFSNIDPNMTVGAGHVGSGQGGLDIDRVQAKGKDLMKSAGAFGGRAQAGAKGLLAKGKSRFGNKGDKAQTPSASASSNNPHTNPSASRSARATIVAKPSDAGVPRAADDAGFVGTQFCNSTVTDVNRPGETYVHVPDTPSSATAHVTSDPDATTGASAEDLQRVGLTSGLDPSSNSVGPTVPNSDVESRPPLSMQNRSRSSISITFSRLRQRSSSSKATNTSRPVSLILQRGHKSESGSEVGTPSKPRSRSRPTSLVFLSSLMSGSKDFNKEEAEGTAGTSENQRLDPEELFKGLDLSQLGGRQNENVYSVRNEDAIASYERSAGITPVSTPGLGGFGDLVSPLVSQDAPTQRTFNTDDPTAMDASQKRKEAWEETGPGDDNASVPQTPTRGDDNSAAKRLGVLPSPATVAFSENAPGSIGGPASRPTTAPVSSGEAIPTSPTTPTSPSVPVMKHRRNNSDLNALPSQTKRVSLGSGPSSPVRNSGTGILWGTDDEGWDGRRSDRASQILSTYDILTGNTTSPRAGLTGSVGLADSATEPVSRHESPDEGKIVFAQPASRYRIVNNTSPAQAARDEQGSTLKNSKTESQPSAETQLVSLRDQPLAGLQEKPSTQSFTNRSEISAQDDFHDAKESAARHERTVSRNSSVSSLGSPQSPDTIIRGENMFMIASHISPHETVQGQTADHSGGTNLQENTSITVAQPPVSPLLQQHRPITPESHQAATEGLSALSPPRQSSSSGDLAPLPPPKDLLVRKTRMTLDERPMSYTPSGAPLPSGPFTSAASATTAAEEPVESIPVDLTAYSGPPLGAPPYQQHPLFRSKGPGPVGSRAIPYDEVRRSSQIEGSPVSVMDIAGQRQSHIFRGSETPASTLPGTDALDLEMPSGRQSRQSSSLSIPLAKARPTKEGEPGKNKRSSGIWGGFKRSSTVTSDLQVTPSATSVQSSSQSQELNTARPTEGIDKTAREIAQRRNVLQKPQRSVSTAAAPSEAKKKRFSGLGKLFGRSGTHGHSTPKPNKLTKAQSPTAEESKRHGYEDFEATLRQNRLANWRDMERSAGETSGVPLPQQVPRETSSAGQVDPPPGGWYAPGDNREEHGQNEALANRISSPTVPTPPPFRRLHSEGSRSRPISFYEEIPEAFRPTEAGYGQPMQPVSPPADNRSSNQFEPATSPTDPSIPIEHRAWPTSIRQNPPSSSGGQYTGYGGQHFTRHASNGPDAGQYGPSPPMYASAQPQQTSYVSPPASGRPSVDSSVMYGSPPTATSSPPQYARQGSYGMGWPLSPQISGRSDYDRTVAAGWAPRQGSVQSISSAGSLERATAMPMRSFSAGSYPQTRNDPSLQSSRAPSWSSQQPSFPPVAEEGVYHDYQQRHPQQPLRQGQYYQGQPPRDQAYNGPPRQRQNSYNDYYGYAQPQPHPQTQRYPQERYYAGNTNPRRSVDDGRPRPLPPPVQAQQRSRQSPAAYYPEHEYSYPPPSAPASFQQRHQQQQPPQYWQASSARPLSYQRTPSGYSGRRDDMAVSEQFSDLGMDGTGSYPGSGTQAWGAPSRV
ncbi:hypothetical protein K431DRAFT_282682 [Polychaeton citri CBS 116435]|uniref:Uncharacterized protein n=1 Tax=Polychaeton citri CBS 116435 TaxID=1314669 RepID=A0A9P4QES4_9PEZI|nr:hypothetical protein K431DRAFT_282682 [Polychaeton citri CBS 116435]